MARKHTRRNRNRNHNHHLVASAFEALENRQLFAATNPTVIDLFMGYTSTARAAVGTQQQMVDKIERSIALLNQGLSNSKVRATVRLVGTMETNYAESGSGDTDVTRLLNTSDGQLDDVSAAAAAAGADVTDLVSSNLDVGGISQFNANVIRLAYLDSGVVSHEFGHTMGAGHAHGPGGAGDGSQTTPYAFEGTMNFNGTILGGALVGSLPLYYSNPSVMYRGRPTGVAGTGPDAADNARVMNENADRVAGARAPVVQDSSGPVAGLGTVWSPVGQNVIRFNVRYADGSGVNVDSLGNDDVFVNGPNGFVASANLVSVDDAAVNYGYHVATYEVATPGAPGDLTAYSFGIRANSITDTANNSTPGGLLTAASNPKLPNYAGQNPWDAAEEGDVTNRSVALSGEAGGKYQMGFNSPAIFHVTLSATNNLNLTSSAPGVFGAMLFRDANNNLQITGDEMVAPTGVGQWANLAPGDNYYVYVRNNGAFGDFRMSAKFDNPQQQPPAPVAPSSIAGYVWTDTNRNARRENDEPGVANVPMTITGLNDLGQNVNAVVNTDANGNFTFTGLRPSNADGYTITRTPPPGAQPTFTIPGSLSGGIVSPDVVSRIIITTPGSAGTDYRFGLAPGVPATTLGGSVYMDTNNNGIREAGEQGIANAAVTITGTDTAANAVNVSVVTNANGDYQFTNLAPSNANGYTLSLTQPNNVLVGKNTVGSLGGQLNATLPNQILQVPVNGVAGTGYLFGEQPLPTNPPNGPNTGDQNNTTGQNNGTDGNVITDPTQIVPQFDFSNGFANAAGRFATNGNASLNGQFLQITPNVSGQAGSAYYNTKLNVTRFNTQFNFTLTPGAFTADGFTFIIQGNGTNALGAGGGALGSWQIPNSVAIKFDLWDNEGEGNTSTGMYLNGAFPTNAGSIDLRPSGFDFHNGNTVQVNMTYDGTTLAVTLKDPTTGATATQNYSVNIPATVGGNTAYVGFTGGTGGASASQVIAGWTYAAPSQTNVTAGAVTGGAMTRARTSGSSLYATLVPNTGPLHAASFTLNRDGSYHYVPKPNFYGTDSFTYEVVDQNGRIATATMKIVVNHVTQPAMENPDTPHALFVNNKGSIDINMNCELEDVQDRPMKFTLGKVKGGTAKLLPDGHTVRFTPAAGFEGLATINYLCSNGLAVSAMQLTVCVPPEVQRPTAKDDSATTQPSTSVKVNALKNDVDPENVHLCLSTVADPAHGTASIDKQGSTNPADWRIVYRPDFGFHGTDTFSYTMTDFLGSPATGKISVKVVPGAGLGVDPFDSTKTALDILGTPRGDDIKLLSTGGGVRVKLNGDSLGVFNPTGTIAAFGDDGDDSLDARQLNRQAWLFGEDGDDNLCGSESADLLVGGRGRDELNAGAGDDRIITGEADYRSAGFGRLNAIFNGSTDLSGYVHDDDKKDRAYGQGGRDTFWANVAGDHPFDQLGDRANGETVIDLA